MDRPGRLTAVDSAAGQAASPRGGPWLAVALAVALALVAGAASLRLLLAPDDAAPLPGRLFATLVAAAFADVAILARNRAPGASWFAAVVAAGIAAIECVAGLRGAALFTDAGPASIGLGLAVLALLAAAAVALLDAIRPRARPSDHWERLGAWSVAVSLAVAGMAAGWTLLRAVPSTPVVAGVPDELTPVRLTGRLALLTVMLGLGVGALRDLRPGIGRAWSTWRATPEGAGARRGSLVDLLADELLPGRAAERERAREAERARLAADIHALVLPDLRRAAAVAEAGVAPADVKAGVRRALADVERLMHERQSIVLEQFGLVAALEWLAERTEDQGSLRVELVLDGVDVEGPDAVRPDVARAAFRVALLALDNVVRHAGATTATVRLQVDDRGTVLEISDDGHGASAGTTGPGRGLVDMRREVTASGGRLEIAMAPGVRIEATWPRR